MRYSILISILLFLTIITKSGNQLASHLQTNEIEVLEEITEELEIEQEIINEGEEDINEEIDIEIQYDEEIDMDVQDIEEAGKEVEEVQETDVENIEDEKEEIIEFKIDGLLLREGIISVEVLRLKEFLIAKGYDEIVKDYYFDQKTREIIIDYQKNNDLVADGIVGINTITKINEDMKLNNIIVHEKQLILDLESFKDNEEILEGNFIVINKDSNTLYHLYKGYLINKYPVATGKDPKYTPEGKFTIVTKFVNPTWGGAGRHKPIKGGAPNNPLGKRWMGLSIRGGGVYGIHGNSDKNSIGRYVSLGCIRMFNEDVEILYDLIDYGTPVWIGTEEKLKEFGIIFDYNIVTSIESETEL